MSYDNSISAILMEKFNSYQFTFLKDKHDLPCNSYLYPSRSDDHRWITGKITKGFSLLHVRGCRNSNRCSCHLYSQHIVIHCGPGSSNGKALDYGLDGPGSIPGVGGVEISLRSFVSRLVLRSTQPPIKWVPGAFVGVKAAERRTSHPTSP